MEAGALVFKLIGGDQSRGKEYLCAPGAADRVVALPGSSENCLAPVAGFGQMKTHLPEMAQRAHQPQPLLDPARGKAVGERGPDILLLLIQNRQPEKLLRRLQPGFGPFGQGHTPGQMAVSQRRLFAALRQPLPGKFPDGLQKRRYSLDNSLPYPRMTVTPRPAGVVACSVVTRSARSGSPLRWSKMTSQPVGNPSPFR